MRRREYLDEQIHKIIHKKGETTEFFYKGGADCVELLMARQNQILQVIGVCTMLIHASTVNQIVGVANGRTESVT